MRRFGVGRSLLFVSLALVACGDEPVSGTVATNRVTVESFPVEECTAPSFEGPDRVYFTTPPEFLDWTATKSDGDYTMLGFRPRSCGGAPTPDQYALAPGFIGANDG